MIPKDIDQLVALLLQGQLPEARPEDLAAGVRRIADSIGIGAGLTEQQVRAAIKTMVGARHFDHARTIGESWRAHKGIDPTIQKLYAQSVIELGGFELAEKLLTEALAAAGGSTNAQFKIELPEYAGLRGRIRKQQYVQSNDVNQLVAATDLYFEQYKAKKQFWHGINIVALRTEEERLQLDLRDGETTSAQAVQVLDLAMAAHAGNPLDHWPLATASEACLALSARGQGSDWCDRAELWLHRFLNHPNTDPFAVESYSRQLREIWHGNPLGGASCPDRLAGIIDRHVRRTERRWSVDPGKVRELRQNPAILEKNFSGEKTFTVAVLKQMLALCPSIGCVLDATNVRLGTGFLMPGTAFGFADPLVFVTNSHVISDDVEDSSPAADARVTFEVESAEKGTHVSHKVKDILFTSEPGELGKSLPTMDKLDVTIVSLRSLPENVPGLRHATNVPLPSPKTKAFLVGHPAAGALQFSLHDSMLLDVDENERLLHYRTPTEPGSSGSPVFNAKWEVVALHHAGSPTTPRLHGLEGEYEANEGITLQAIRSKLGAA
jgi:V8-like Glu-specific endopeptidase